jgi:4-amino-4-deoxy-L-arabinose transferase-like glycosyltransferase
MSKRRAANRWLADRAAARHVAEPAGWSGPQLTSLGTLGVVAALLAVIFLLGSIGITWGQPSGQLWHTDSIAGLKTVYEMPNLFGQWKNKYPRVHFLINAAAYKPFLDYWSRRPVTVADASGRAVRTILDVRRISTLIIVSRVISVLMAAGAVLAVFLAGRLLFGDWLAGFLAGLALAVCQIFVFYSHLGNVDVPATFWFAWAVYWAVKSAYEGRWHHFVLLGLFCALAACTKDPLAGFVVGLALAVWLAMAARARAEGTPFKAAVITVFSRKVLVAVLVAGFWFALLNDLLTTPSAYSARMGHWVGGPGVTKFNIDFAGQWPLLKETYRQFYYSLGWPLLFAAAASAAYCLIRFPSKAGFAAVPLVVFYLVIVVNIRMTNHRYFLPALPGVALVVGAAFADWLRWRKVPFVLRLAPVAFVYGLSGLYCLGVDLEMARDSRYDAERWLVENVDRRTHIAAICPPCYAPRLELMGFSCSYRCSWDKPSDQKVLLEKPAWPAYIIMSQKWYTDVKFFDQGFRKAIFDGSLGYHELARFRHKYLWPRRTIFGLAGRPQPLYDVISPEVIVLQRHSGTGQPGGRPAKVQQ